MPATALPNLWDGGIDIRWSMYGISFGAQCKNHSRKIGPVIVRELRGALDLISIWILGVVVIPFKLIYLNGKYVDGYSHDAQDTADRLGIVLTNLEDI
ncbi:3150_t:CDS:2 [Gigaspora rosea]|nr:3150_t:CDS:2 [Gigaspora rosea]